MDGEAVATYKEVQRSFWPIFEVEMDSNGFGRDGGLGEEDAYWSSAY